MDRHDPTPPDRPEQRAVGDPEIVEPGHLDGLVRRGLFDLQVVDAPDLAPVVEAVLRWIPGSAETVLPILVTPNVDIIVQLDRAAGRPEVDVYRRARYVLPDGMPIVKASRLLGVPLSSRLTGSGLFELLWPELVTEGRPVVIVCANDEIVNRLDPPEGNARFVVPPLFDADDRDAVDAVVDQLLKAAIEVEPGLVLLGLGHPKDALLSARLIERWPGPDLPLCCCLGGSFAMYVGLQRRAPVWVQNSGLEWFYRFLQEPRRLFHRYFVRDIAFIGIVARAYRRRRREPAT